MKRAVGTLIAGLAILISASNAQAVGLQQVGSFAEPTYVTSDPGNPNRLFVVQRAGRILQLENGAVTEFANLESVVSCCSGEQGLLSIALAPDFDSSGRLFVDYTGRESPWPEIHVAELRAAGTAASTTTLRQLLRIPHPNQTNHYGGQLQFGPEGLLFVGTGDGGGGNDVEHNAQNRASLLGKILRIGVDPSGVLPYTVPSGNPFAASANANEKLVFAYGLRNPYRFSFDRLSHDLVIGDVGEKSIEEIDWAPAPGLGAGADYGWNCEEGRLPGTPPLDPECATPPAAGFADPVFEYPHLNGAQAIIGGYVARDPSLPELYGRYLYGDFGNGAISSLLLSEAAASNRSEGIPVGGLVSFGEDSCGRLYAVSATGPVFRLVGSTPNTCTPPVATTPLSPSTVGIRAVTRRVKRNGRAQITVWVSPCKGRHGQAVRLRRGKVKLGSRRLDRACTARFLPRVTHRVKFQAEVRADDTYAAAASRKLGIRVYHPKREAKKRGARLHVPAGVGRR